MVCKICGGTGTLQCKVCSGTGILNGKVCPNCEGVGIISCYSCYGSAKISHKGDFEIEVYGTDSKEVFDLASVLLNKEAKHNEELKSINHKFLEVSTICFTISGALWGIVYAILNTIGYPTAIRESLIIFGICFFITLIIYFIKK